MTERNFRDQPAKRRRRGRFRDVIRKGALVVNDPVGRFSKYDERIAKLRTFAEAMNAPMRTGEKWKLRDILREEFWQHAARNPMAFETATEAKVSDTARSDKETLPTSATTTASSNSPHGREEGSFAQQSGSEDNASVTSGKTGNHSGGAIRSMEEQTADFSRKKLGELKSSLP
jgi:hypothetical protein